MRRKVHDRLWTLILMLLLCGASLTPAARVARADTTPADPLPGAPPGDPQAGDPDSPVGGKSLPAPGPHRGYSGQSMRVTTVPQQSGWGIWMLRLRMAFAAVYRGLFRI
jgi:hypothetical protein